MKKFFSFILSVVMLLSILTLYSVSSFAQTSEDGLWNYKLNDDGTVEIGSVSYDRPAYLGEEKNVTVPSEIDGHTVVSIGNWAFLNKNLSSVSIPYGIKNIGDRAFAENRNLTSVVIPDSVEAVGSEVFVECRGLESVTISKNLKRIGNYMFNQCHSLKTVEIPDSVEYIGEAAFNDNKSLQTVKFGKNVKQISWDAFSGCTSLSSLDLPASVTVISDNAFSRCTSLSSINAPDTLKTVGENIVENTAFYNNAANWSGQMLYLGNALVDVKTDITGTALVNSKATVIASRAFNKCSSLSGVTIAGKARILTQAFLGCTSLSTITFLDEIPYVGYNAFTDTAYYQNENNWIGNVLYIGNVLIKANKNITGTYYVKNGTVTIASYAFDYCQNKEFEGVALPETVKYIGNDAFSRSTLKKVNIPSKVTEIPSRAFYACNLTEIEIPDTVKTIGPNAFTLCRSLKNVTIPRNVETVGSGAFSECYTLESVTFDNTVTTIDDSAFDSCSMLKTIYGYRETAAEEYANKHSITFIELPDPEPLPDFPDVKKGTWYYDAVMYCAKNGFVTGYQNGKFGPGDNLKRQDFVVILARIANADLTKYQGKASKLKDVDKNAYYASSVNWAVDNGIISGYQNGKFGVGDNITREQVATILYRYMGSPDVDNPNGILAKFKDASKVSSFAKTAVAWAVQNSIINGMADGRVASTEGASRAQIAVIIMKMDQQGMFDLV